MESGVARVLVAAGSGPYGRLLAQRLAGVLHVLAIVAGAGRFDDDTRIRYGFEQLENTDMIPAVYPVALRAGDNLETGRGRDS